MPTAELCRKHGVSTASYYKWRSRYGGMEVSEAKKLRDFAEENRRLKALVADLTLDNQMLKAVNSKKWWLLQSNAMRRSGSWMNSP